MSCDHSSDESRFCQNASGTVFDLSDLLFVNDVLVEIIVEILAKMTELVVH